MIYENFSENNAELNKQYRDLLVSYLATQNLQCLRASVKELRLDVHELGKDPVQIVGIHMLAMASVYMDPQYENLDQNSFFERSGGVLIEVINTMNNKNHKDIEALKAANRVLNDQLKLESARCDRLEDQAKILDKQSKVLAHRFIQAQEEERKEISRELHDQVAQALAGINVCLATIKTMATQEALALKKKIAQTQKLVEHSVKTVHNFAQKLRPTMLDDLGLIPSLRTLIKEIPKQKLLTIHFAAFPEVELLNSQNRTVLYRVVQEALTNVIRHARARTVDISIVQNSDTIHLEVVDDGKSFEVDRIVSSQQRKHLGLLGMRERVEMVGGHFMVTSSVGVGTNISVDIPFIIGNEA